MAATAGALSVGRLETFPLTDLLVFLVEQRATGTLVLQERGNRKSAFYFYLGAAVKAHTPAILTAHSSEGEAVAQHLEWAAALGGTTAYGFYPGVDYLHRLRPAPANPLAQIWRSARRSVNPARVNGVISALGDRPLALHFRADLGRFCFAWDEVAALELLRLGKYTFNDLLATFDGDLATLCKLVYVLVICRHLDIPGKGEPVGIEGPDTIVAPRLPPPGSIPTPVTQPRPYHSSRPPPRAVSGMKRQVKAQAGPPSSPKHHSTHPPGPSRAESGRASHTVETAHLRAHPAARGVSTQAPASSSRAPHGRIRPAARPSTVSDEQRRIVDIVDIVDIVELREPTVGIGTPRHGATDSWGRAESLSHSGNHAKALELVQDRYRPEWNNADRGAFVAYLKARCGVLGVDEGIQMLEACSKAVMENPDELKFRFYRAWVYKTLGRENAALMDFVEVVREDPSNVDAARELYLARKRRTAAASSSGLMNRLRRSLTPAPSARPEVVISSRPTVRTKPR